MKSRIPVIILSLFFFSLLLTGVFGQEALSPFISQLRAEVKGNQILLSWKDNPEHPDAHYLVYRHTEEISDKNFSQAVLLGEVDPAVESYSDLPPSGKDFYYTVIVKDKQGKSHAIFIPFRNKTTQPLRVTAKVTEEGYAVVSDLKTSVSRDESVIITFSTSRRDRILNLYASTKPILSTESLLVSTRLATFSSSQNRYVDFPLPGVPYYYALIDSELLKTGNIPLSLGINTTEKPVELPLTQGMENRRSTASVRGKPLPFFNIPSSILEGSSLVVSPFIPVEPFNLSQKSRKEIDSLLSNYKAPQKGTMEPVILSLHRSNNLEGEDLYLRDLIKKGFSEGRWIELEKSLREFLRIRRDKEIEAAARFYLGQSLYFQGRIREAFFEFLLADLPYKETQPWINKILEDLSSGN